MLVLHLSEKRALFAQSKYRAWKVRSSPLPRSLLKKSQKYQARAKVAALLQPKAKAKFEAALRRRAAEARERVRQQHAPRALEIAIIVAVLIFVIFVGSYIMF